MVSRRLLPAPLDSALALCTAAKRLEAHHLAGTMPFASIRLILRRA
jgi:hypothetical protein